MKDDTVIALRQPGSFSDDPLTDILRAGARQLLAQAIEAEVEGHIVAVPPINSVRRRNPDLSGWCPIAFVTRTRSCVTAFSRTFAVAPCDSSRSSRLVINWTSFGAPAKPVAGAPRTPGFLCRLEFIGGTAHPLDMTRPPNPCVQLHPIHPPRLPVRATLTEGYTRSHFGPPQPDRPAASVGDYCSAVLRPGIMRE